MICANCKCENNKTLLLINTKFPPSTSAEKISFNSKGKKRKQISATKKLTNELMRTEQSDCNLHNVRDVATT